MANIEWKKFSWEVVKGLAIGTAALASFFANQNAERAKIVVEQTKLQLDQAKAALEKEKQQAKLNMKAFEFVKQTLSLDNPEKSKGQGLAAAAIVNALTTPPLRDSLQAALGSRYPILQSKISDAQKFDADQEELNLSEHPPEQQSPLSFGNMLEHVVGGLIPSAYAQEFYRIDIFYCEDTLRSVTEKRERQAKEAQKKIQAQGLSAKLRVRLLPTLIQARPGYQVFLDEIRYSKVDNEDMPANRLSEILSIPTNNINYSTPKYISVFYCAKSTYKN